MLSYHFYLPPASALERPFFLPFLYFPTRSSTLRDMASASFQKRCVRVCCFLWLVDIQLHTPSCGFGRTRQQPLSELRERTGLAIRVSATGADGPVLSKEERKLLRQIAIAGEKRDWPSAESYFGTYAGSGTQIYGAAMHAAFRCREYKKGAKVYDQCRQNCEIVSQPIFNLGIRIFAKLGDTTRVQQIWDDALKAYPLDDILASARISAAAEAGNVTMAAETLDKMKDCNVSVQTHHVNSAMRACWGWNDRPHKAAKYLFDLLPKFELSPTVVSFTALIGTYNTASLHKILSAYDEMKALHIKPDTVFAETYIFSLLQADKKVHLRASGTELLRDNSIDRLQAARDALTEFKEAGLHLSRVCAKVDRALKSTGF